MASKVAPAEAAPATVDRLQPPARRDDKLRKAATTTSRRSDQVMQPLVMSTVGTRRSTFWREEMCEPPSHLRHFLRARRLLKPIIGSKAFKAIQVVSLGFALFGGGVWILADIPDDPGNVVLDVLMILVMFFFLLELVCTSIVDHRDYPMSSFFWMDILGTFSMVFEISFLLGNAGRINTNDSNVEGALLRAVRATKVAARAGRLTKILKCLSVMNMNKKTTEVMVVSDGVHAKILSSKLMLTLSTKVSLLTIVLVLVVPLFQIGQYPEEDLSMRAWSQRLEDDYGRAYATLAASTVANTTDIFQKSVLALRAFYSDVYYAPFKVEGFPQQVMISGRAVTIPGASVLSGQEPSRQQNVVRKSVGTCAVARRECEGEEDIQAAVFWDFTQPYMVSAGMDIAMIIFIIVVMAAASANFNHTLDQMIVRPIEQILGMLKVRAANILKDFGLTDDDDDQGDETDGRRRTETELLESIFSKLARLATLAARRNVTEAEIAGLDHEGKGVMMDMMQMEVRQGSIANRVSRDSEPLTLESPETVDSGTPVAEGAGSGGIPATVVLPGNKEHIDSWDVDFLGLDEEAQRQAVLYIFFDSQLGSSSGRMWTTLSTFARFHSKVKGGYNDLNYHNFHHACDVLHTCFRLVCCTLSDRWLGDIDQHALLVAALCHDLGHQGLTNPFLVETKHDLALRYNDKSPLENMHCANLFQICSDAQTNVFEKAGKTDHKQARKVCISTILHTDLVHHFDMVRDISRVYELNSELSEQQARSRNELLPQYEEQVLQKESMLFLELFLHLADISNPLKPFNICQAWAWRVLDEFFAQGDEEKRLGLPVGMLNDRDKVNRPGSQHGFINLIVAPLAISTVQLFAPLHPLTTQMVSNLESWRNLWVEDVKPSVEDVAKRDAEVQKLREMAQELSRRFS